MCAAPARDADYVAIPEMVEPERDMPENKAKD